MTYRFDASGKVHDLSRLSSQTSALPVRGIAENRDPGSEEFLRNSFQNHTNNLDHNSGSPIGISVCHLSAHKGKGVTASGAYLASIPPNLAITTEAKVTRILTKGTSAVGVEADRKHCISRRPA